MAIRLSPKIAYPTGFPVSEPLIPNRAELDFDGIVAGLGRQRQGKIAKKRRR
jgi:hypothetical protein